MSHYYGVVLVPSNTSDIKAQVAQLLERFNINTELPPYKDYMTDSTRAYHSRRHKIAPGRWQELAEAVNPDEEQPWLADEHGLYKMSTRNPAGAFDWWMIGGRWDGVIQGERRPGSPYEDEHQRVEHNSCLARELRASVRSRLASDHSGKLSWDFLWFIITPDDAWHENPNGFWNDDVKDVEGNREREEIWWQMVDDILAAHEDCTAVGVDCHL
jgi:hypothetical protein